MDRPARQPDSPGGHGRPLPLHDQRLPRLRQGHPHRAARRPDVRVTALPGWTGALHAGPAAASMARAPRPGRPRGPDTAAEERTMTGADLFVQALMDRGVTFVTTLSGNGTEPFYEACQRAGLRLIDFRNEQAAAFAADAAARLTRRLAVCAVSAAVGHTNALIGVVNAWFDGAPLLLFSGSAAHA